MPNFLFKTSWTKKLILKWIGGNFENSVSYNSFLPLQLEKISREKIASTLKALPRPPSRVSQTSVTALSRPRGTPSPALGSSPKETNSGMNMIYGKIWLYKENFFFVILLFWMWMSHTLPTAEILSGKNAWAFLVCGFLMKLFKNNILKIWKKSWEPCGSYLLNSTANPAQFGWKWTGWFH